MKRRAPKTKLFPLRVLLTVTTRRLLTRPRGPDNNGIEDLFSIIEWMTGDEPFIHQLKRCGEKCRTWLLKWFPELAQADNKLGQLDEIVALLGENQGVEAWLAAISAFLPKRYAVPRIPEGHYTAKDSYDELVEMRGTDQNIIVVAGDHHDSHRAT